MRKIYSLLLLLLVNIVAMGKIVTPDEARQNITSFMAPRRASGIGQNLAVLQLVATSHYQERAGLMAPSYYVFNVGEGQGYVIAGADDRIPTVLGYSDRGSFDPENIPANMQAWLREYSRQMAYLNSHPEAAAPRTTVSGNAIAPMLDPIAWGQGSPYNNRCPKQGSKPCLTGCVATAMAQILYYWKYPAATTDEIPGYTTQKNRFKMPAIPAGTTIDWDNLLPNYVGKETAAQQDAVANLMLMCGTAVSMDYTTDFSGAYGGNVASSLLAYFDYDAATVYESRIYFRTAEWNQKVYDELVAGRPVYYDGASSGSGHAFVIDGYGGDDYFHVNWGWGGDSNDYFLLTILDPNNNTGAGATSSSDGYSFDQGAIFGAQPNTGMSPSSAPILTTDAVAVPGGTVFTRNSIDEDFNFKVGFSYINCNNSTYTFDWGPGIFTVVDGNLQFVSVPFHYWSNLPPNTGFFDSAAYPFDIKYGKGIASGTFAVLPVSAIKGSNNWTLNQNYDIYNVVGFIEGNTLTIVGSTFGLTGTLAATGKTEVASPVPVTAAITNNGTYYMGEIFLLVDGQMVGGRHFDIKSEDTQNVELSFTPSKPGKKEVALCTRTWNGNSKKYDYTAFITDSITIEAAPTANLAIVLTVDNAQNGIVAENAITLRATITNQGTAVYDNDIQTSIYKDLHDGSGMFGYLATIKQTVTIGSRETIEVPFTFNDLEDDKYLFVVSYLSKGEWKDVQSRSYTVRTHEPDPVPTLTTSARTINAVYKGGTYIVKSDTAIVSVKVKNIGELDYNDNITVKLYKLYDASHGNRVATVSKPIQLAIGAETTVVMEFPGLEDDATYFYWTYYIADRNEVAGSEYTPIFTVELPSVEPDPDGIELVEAQQGSATIYGLNGNKLTEVNVADIRQTIKQLPKGLYIVRTAQLSKVVRN